MSRLTPGREDPLRKTKSNSFALILVVLVVSDLAAASGFALCARAAPANAQEAWEVSVSNILEHCLHPPKGREIVIVHDARKALLADHFVRALRQRGTPVSTFFVGEDVQSSIPEFEQLLTNDQVGLILLASPRIFHGLGLRKRLEFRDNVPSIRCDCHPVFFDTVIPTENLVRLYSVDPAETDDYLGQLKGQLPEQAKFRLTAPGGTELEFTSREWRKWPWEIATYPIENSINGTISVDGAVFFSEVTSPIRLTIRAGMLTSIECVQENDPICGRYIKMMREVCGRDPLNWQLAEVGIGGNQQARLSNILMESESVRGTCHFCFGDNSEFGGENKTDWHGGTVIVKAPTLKCADRVIRPRY